jgi:hypothetical protein
MIGQFYLSSSGSPASRKLFRARSLHLGSHGCRLERFFPHYRVTRAAPGRATPLVELDSIVPGIPAATFN